MSAVFTFALQTKRLAGTKTAAVASTTIINEISISNYLFPAFTGLSERSAKVTSVGVNQEDGRQRTKQSSICFSASELACRFCFFVFKKKKKFATTTADSLQVCLIQLDTKVCSSDGVETHGRPNVACWK